MKTKSIAAQVRRTLLACMLPALLALNLRADLVLNGGGLALVEEGGTIAPGNIAAGGTAFAKDVLPHELHTIPHLNDQIFGNSYSWIGNSTDSFAGINLGATPVPVSSIAFGRDSTDTISDRTLGIYTLQYTTVPNPDATTPDASWTTIGTLNYQSAGGTNFAYPSRRHRYTFTPVSATGLRLHVPAAACLEELEIYGLPALSAHFTSAADIPVSSDGYAAAGRWLDLSLGFAPPLGTTLTVIDNTGSDPIDGEFSNLAHGATTILRYDGMKYSFAADYSGGTGNDLVLHWVSAVPLSADASLSGLVLGSGTLTPAFDPTVTSYAAGVSASTITVTPTAASSTAAVTVNGTAVASGTFSRSIALARGSNTINIGVAAEDGSSSTSYTVVIYSFPTVVAWGLNDRGQSNVPANLGEGAQVVAASAGGYHSLALKMDGTVAAWGDNSFNQCSIPDHLNGMEVISISAGASHSLALKADGTVVAWGDNRFNQCTLPDSLSGVKATAIAAGAYHSVALTEDGTVIAWGDNSSGQCNVPTSLSSVRVTAISAGGYHIAVQKEDGTVFAWGNNGYGQSTIPEIVSGIRVRAIEAGYFHTVVLKEDGILVAWGRNEDGQSTAPASLSSGGVIDVAPGLYHTVALKHHGTVVSWGSNYYDQQSVPERLSGVISIDACANHTLALTQVESDLTNLSLNTGTLSPPFDPAVTNYTATVPYSVTDLTVTPVLADNAAGVQVLGGSNLAVGPNTIKVTVFGTTTRVYTVAVTRAIAAAFTTASTIPITSEGYTATGSAVDISLGFAPPAGTILTVVNNTGLAFIQGQFSNLAQGQTVILPYNGVSYRFVADYYGGTGNDLVLHWAKQGAYYWGGGATSPIAVNTSGVLAGKTVVQMEGGGGFFLARCADGTVFGRGANGSGQLGDGTTTTQFAPVNVSMAGALTGKFIVSVAAGDAHSLALCSDGSVAAWGANANGQLGIGSTSTYSLFPVEVQFTGNLAGKKVVAVDAGSSHSIALFSDGTVAAWGYNFYGQLGDGTKIDKYQPVEVLRSGALAGKTVTSVSTMYFYCLALCSDGTAVSWGSGFIGQLGNNDTKDSNQPVTVQITGKTVVSLVAGSWHSVFLCSDGTVLTCGHNALGELGDGTYASPRKIPVEVVSSGILADRQVVAVASEWHSTLALCSDGKVASWGLNDAGQLGNGATTNSNLPVWVNDSDSLAGKTVVAVAAGNSQGLAVAASPLSSTSSLSGLTISSGTLGPAFASRTTSYIVNLAWNVETLSITPTATDIYATVTVNGSPVTSGVASSPITLTTGTNPIEVVVTAENGIPTTYSIQVNVEANSLPTFSGFTGSTGWQTAASVSCVKILARASDADGDALTVTSAGPSSTGGGTAVLQGASILYTPADGFSGADSFLVTITDARGASVEGMVSMNVGPAPSGGGQGGNTPILTLRPDGKVGVAFQGIPGRIYQIQRSTNLAEWSTIGTVSAAGNGAVGFIDEDPPAGSGFYRLRKP